MRTMWTTEELDAFDPEPYLDPDKTYTCDDTGIAWWTPDGIGCYWYDNLDQALADRLDESTVMYVDGDIAALFQAVR